MNKSYFPHPQEIKQLASYLNASKKTVWNLSVTEKDSHFFVIDGDQPMFSSDKKDEVYAFLFGAFLSEFEGNDLIDLELNF